MGSDNSYYNEPIDFYIEKPNDWVFIPTQWVANIRNKSKLSNEEIAILMEQANMPFVYMQKPLPEDNLAYPTVQATCRYSHAPGQKQKEQLVRLQLQAFERNFNDFELIESSTDQMISGHSSIYLKVKFSIKNESGTVFNCLSRSWNVFYNNIAYTIGVSGAPENIDEYIDDTNIIISSVLIGSAA